MIDVAYLISLREHGWTRAADELESLSSKLETYRKLTDDMRQWHAVVAYSDFDKHEALWASYIVRAEELTR